MMHPRLLSSLILCEPVILEARDGGPNPALMSTMRRDLWDSRSKAESSLRKAFGLWDPRALDRYLHYGLRDVPTTLYDAAKDPRVPKSAVTLTTSKHQEAWAYAQPNLESREAGLDPLLLPDWRQEEDIPYLYARPECHLTIRNLPHLRPAVLYVFGDQSPLSPPASQEQKLRITGIGVGGSGGAVNGKVQKAVLKDAGHLLVFERIKDCVQCWGDWIADWQRTGWLRKLSTEVTGIRSRMKACAK